MSGFSVFLKDFTFGLVKVALPNSFGTHSKPIGSHLPSITWTWIEFSVRLPKEQMYGPESLLLAFAMYRTLTAFSFRIVVFTLQKNPINKSFFVCTHNTMS